MKAELHRRLQRSRAHLLSRLDGLREYDRRRPLVPSGTNLLGLVKHLAGVEYGYFVEAFGRPRPEPLPWVDDGSIWRDADMWATPDQTSEYIVGLYRRACERADRTIEELDLQAPAVVDHWRPERRNTTLAVLLVHMVVETAQHAGHADVLRELVDGRVGPDLESPGPALFEVTESAAREF
ncbi:MAG TPA: DinB family protein [Nakamurella sp.]